MEATAVLAGEPHSDRPACVHPVLATLARVVNDAVADEVRATLLPLSVRLIGTASLPADRRCGFGLDGVSRRRRA
jgi:hypothetical protein